MYTKNTSAFPSPEGPTNGNGRTAYAAEFGLTIRAYFAAKMMQGIFACSHVWPNDDDYLMMARGAVKAADALADALGMGELPEITEMPF